jgi:hypothetical protein
MSPIHNNKNVFGIKVLIQQILIQTRTQSIKDGSQQTTVRPIGLRDLHPNKHRQSNLLPTNLQRRKIPHHLP